MDTLAKTVIEGAPNFVGFVMLSTALMYVIRLQHGLINRLIEQWRQCEETDDELIRIDKIKSSALKD